MLSHSFQNRNYFLFHLVRFAFLSTGIVLLGLVLFMSIMPAGPVHVVENFFELNRIRAELKSEAS